MHQSSIVPLFVMTLQLSNRIKITSYLSLTQTYVLLNIQNGQIQFDTDIEIIIQYLCQNDKFKSVSVQ